MRVFTTVEIKDAEGIITQTDKFVGLGIIISAEGKIIMNSLDLPKDPETTEFLLRLKIRK